MADERATQPHGGEARKQWRAERTTFQRVYDVLSGATEYVTATEIGEQADCSTAGARDALSQLVEMGIAETRGKRPSEYRRNNSYFRWKRIERLAGEHTPAELRAEVDALLEEDESLQERFGVPDPDAVSPAEFEATEHAAVHDRWEALTRWRSVREDIAVLQQAIHRAEGDTEGQLGSSASA